MNLRLRLLLTIYLLMSLLALDLSLHLTILVDHRQAVVWATLSDIILMVGSMRFRGMVGDQGLRLDLLGILIILDPLGIPHTQGILHPLLRQCYPPMPIVQHAEQYVAPRQDTDAPNQRNNSGAYQAEENYDVFKIIKAF
jgi:hypothetical protein